MKVLFIGLDYYHYPKTICSAFEDLGYSVEFHAIEPKSFFFKFSRYFAKRMYRRSLDKYHRDIIEGSSASSYDIVFFVTSHFVSIDNFNRLRQLQKDAKFIAYHWDSLAQYNYLPTMPFFDKVITFDREDAEALGIDYLPLFCANISSAPPEDCFEIDAFTVSSIVHVRRYLMLDKLRAFLEKEGISYFFHLKVTPITYLRLLFSGILPRGVTFRTLSQSELLELTRSSVAAIDVANHQQSGLTMRVIENIASGKKVVTTNQNILKEDFYSEDQILLIHEDDFSSIPAFIGRKTRLGLNKSLYVNSWLSQILK